MNQEDRAFLSLLTFDDRCELVERLRADVYELRALLEPVFSGADVLSDSEWVERARVALNK